MRKQPQSRSGGAQITYPRNKTRSTAANGAASRTAWPNAKQMPNTSSNQGTSVAVASAAFRGKGECSVILSSKACGSAILPAAAARKVTARIQRQVHASQRPPLGPMEGVGWKAAEDPLIPAPRKDLYLGQPGVAQCQGRPQAFAAVHGFAIYHECRGPLEARLQFGEAIIQFLVRKG